MKEKRQCIKSFAFTLSEVLITLGIIGVVAALTIPTLLKNSEQTIWLNQFRGIYSTLSQAYVQAWADYGDAKTWYDSGDSADVQGQKIYDILSKYLSVSESHISSAQASKYITPGTVSTLGVAPSTITRHNFFILKNGTIIFISGYDGAGGPMLEININGNKGPNRLGHDVFLLTLDKKNNAPFVNGLIGTWADDVVDCDAFSVGGNPWTNGSACASWVVRHWNLDYLNIKMTSSQWRK